MSCLPRCEGGDQGYEGVETLDTRQRRESQIASCQLRVTEEKSYLNNIANLCENKLWGELYLRGLYKFIVCNPVSVYFAEGGEK